MKPQDLEAVPGKPVSLRLTDTGEWSVHEDPSEATIPSVGDPGFNDAMNVYLLQILIFALIQAWSPRWQSGTLTCQVCITA